MSEPTYTFTITEHERTAIAKVLGGLVTKLLAAPVQIENRPGAMPEMPCTRCGAPIHDGKCAVCGTPPAPTSGTDQARAILSPPAAAQSKPTASPIALRDRWARDRHGVELPEPEGYEVVEVNLWKSEQKKPRNKPDAKPFLKVTWQAPNGSGYVDANCFDEKLWPWVISQQGKKARVYVVRNGAYLNLVGLRA